MFPTLLVNIKKSGNTYTWCLMTLSVNYSSVVRVRFATGICYGIVFQGVVLHLRKEMETRYFPVGTQCISLSLSAEKLGTQWPAKSWRLLFSSKQGQISVYATVSNWLWGLYLLLTKGAEGSFLQGKANCLPPYSTEFKNTWSFTTTLTLTA